MEPLNLGISRPGAIAITMISLVIALVTLVLASAYHLVDPPALMAFLATFGLAVPTIIAALKATEAADTVSKVQSTVQYTASQNAAMHQVLTAHCGDICPLTECPLRLLK